MNSIIVLMLGWDGRMLDLNNLIARMNGGFRLFSEPTRPGELLCSKLTILANEKPAINGGIYIGWAGSTLMELLQMRIYRTVMMGKKSRNY